MGAGFLFASASMDSIALRACCYLGGAIVGILALCGVVVCAAAARRSDVNSKAAWSLAAVWAAVAVAGVSAIAFTLLSNVVPLENLALLVAINAVALIVVLLLLAIVLALVGLHEVRRQSKMEAAICRSGRRHAAWALVSAPVIMIGIAAAGEAVRWRPQREIDAVAVVESPNAAEGEHPKDLVNQPAPARKDEAPPVVTHSEEKPLEVKPAAVNFGKLLARMFPVEAPLPPPPRPDELNFRFRPPGGTWLERDPRRINPLAALAYYRLFPTRGLVVIGEKTGVELNLNLESLEEAVRANLRAAAPDARQLDERLDVINGLVGVRLISQATIAGSPTVMVAWLCTRNGFTYQIQLTGPADDRQRLEKDVDELLDGFEVVDTELICHSPGYGPMENFSAPTEGVEIRVAGSPWRNWQNRAAVIPLAAMGALTDHAAMVLIPIHLMDTQPPTDARREAFLAMLGQNSASGALKDRAERKVDGADATLASFQFDASAGKVFYRVCLLEKNDCAYFVEAWSLSSAARASEALDDILGRIRLTPCAAVSVPANARPPISAQAAKDHQLLLDLQNARQAQFFNNLGLYYYDAGQFADSEPYFEKAVDAAPQMTQITENYLNTCVANNHFQSALAIMDRHDKDWKGVRKLRLVHALALGRMSRSEDAIREYAEIFTGGFRSDDHFAYYAHLLEEAGRRDAALEAIDRYLAAGDSLQVAIAQARCLSHRGDHEKAIELLKARHASAPGNASATQALMDALELADRLTEAHELAKQMAADGYASADTLFRTGHLELKLKHYKEAKATLEAALKKAPDDDRIRSYLDHISAVLGEGANIELKAPLEPVKLPAALSLDSAPKLSEEALADAPAYYRNFVEAIEFVPRKVHKVTKYESIELVTASGVDRFSTALFDFDPLAEQIYVNRLEVYDADGKLVTKGDVADYFVADAEEGEIASQKKSLHIPIAGIRPGSRIELCVTVQDIVPPAELPYRKHFFSTWLPFARNSFVVVTDPELVKWEGSEDLQSVKDSDCVYWTLDAPPVIRYESYEAEMEKFVPYVRLVDKGTTWRSEVDDYWKSIEKLCQPDDEVRRLAEEVTKEATDETSKATAILAYVRNQLTYKAIEFGRRARIMNSAGKTLRNKYGDCKDHSLLLYQLLRAAGISANLALVETEGLTSDATPSMDQFNHMIVYTQDNGRERFMDATEKDTDPALSAPAGLAGKLALILDSANPRLVRIGEYPADSMSIDVARKVRFAADGSAETEDQVTFGAYYAGSMRGVLKAMSLSQRKSYMQAYFSEQEATEIEDISFQGLDDPRQPVVMNVKYKSSRLLQAAGGHLTGRLPAPSEFSLLSAPPVEKRRSPLWLQFPMHFTAAVILHLPTEYRLSDESQLASHGSGQFFNWRRESSRDDDGVKLRCDVRRTSGHYSPEKYRDFRGEVETARNILGPAVILQKTVN
jgi:tetratricopeptide (TPR) repeat protein